MRYEELEKELDKFEELSKYELKVIDWIDDKEFIIVSLLSLGFGFGISAYLFLSGAYSILEVARTPLMFICVSGMFYAVFFAPYLIIKIIQRCYYIHKCEKLSKELKLFKWVR
jgi:hypothetical protein